MLRVRVYRVRDEVIVSTCDWFNPVFGPTLRKRGTKPDGET